MNEITVHPLQQARKKLGIKQQVLADLTGLSLPTIKRAEQGKPLGDYAISAICNYFSTRYKRQIGRQELGLHTRWEDSELNDNIGNSDEHKEIPITNYSDKQSSTELSTIKENEHIYNILANFIQRERIRIFNALAPGSTNLRVKDILNNDRLFISPPWEILQGNSPSTNLIEYLINTLIEGQSVLLLGEAGQGKTTILKQVFSRLAEKFLDRSDNATPFPLYIPLRDFTSLTGNAIELLWTYIHDKFPLSFNEFTNLVKNNQIIFLFDSFDEIKGELTQSSLNDRASSRIFARSSILSCRKSFFDFYLSMSPLQEYYPQWIELQPLELTTPVTQYITAFYQHKRNKATLPNAITADKIINMIRNNQKLQDLVHRPLLLIMMLDIFTDPREIKETEWSTTKLYEKYTEKWLKNEAAKPDSALKWNKKDMLLQDVAWLTHIAKSSLSSPYRLRQNETFTHNDLASIVKNVAEHYTPITEMQLLDELCFRTLLGIAEGDNYYFLHKSFHEYYIAKHIFERLHDKGFHADTVTLIGQVLQEVLPFEVTTFLKEMLESKELTQNERNLIVNNLIEVYQQHKTNEVQSTMIREQASHYLARLGTLRATQFLEQSYEKEPDSLVQRGMMVSLALYCNRRDILERYIKIVRSDPKAAAINLGYHLVYYGDQAQIRVLRSKRRKM